MVSPNRASPEAASRPAARFSSVKWPRPGACRSGAGDELCRRGHDPQVGGERQVEARVDRGTADGGDGRYADTDHCRECPVDGLEVAVGVVLGGVEPDAGEHLPHGSGAKVRASRQDKGSHIVVGLGPQGGLAQVGAHLDGQGIATLRRVKGNRRDAVGDGIADLGQSTPGRPSSWLRYRR